MTKKPRKLNARHVRSQLVRMSDEQILFIARGAIDELTSRSVIKCSVAVQIIEFLSPENVKIRNYKKTGQKR